MKAIVAFDEGAVKTTDPNKTIAITIPAKMKCNQAAWKYCASGRVCSRSPLISAKKV